MNAIADTGFLVAFLNRTDQHHHWATTLANDVTAPLICCEPVLTEAAYLVGSVPLVMGLLASGFIEIAFDLEDNRSHITDLAERYADQRPDLCDLCVVRLSELFPSHKVITTDRVDFRVYRRNKREAIPLICPPE
ncbi:MAG TPA: pilus assembly protein [Verrucomicrobiae bacterium]